MAWADVVRDLRLDLLGSLLLATLLGAAVGLEREFRGKAAGLRTMILICVGATLFTHLSIAMAGPNGDPARIAAQIVTGIGFLGAGTILRGRGEITGLTTAATIWLSAAIGVAVGAGAIYEAAGATLLVLFVLRALGAAERYMQRDTVVARLAIQTRSSPERVEEIRTIVQGAGLEIQDMRHESEGDHLVIHLVLRGRRPLHDEARLALLRSSGAYTLREEES